MLTARVKAYLFYFIVLIFGFVSVAPFFSYFNIIIEYNYIYIDILGTILLGFLSFNSIKYTFSHGGRIIIVFLVIIVFMLINGLLREDSVFKVLITDGLNYMRFFFLMVLGYRLFEFTFLKKALINLLFVGIIMNIIAMTIYNSSANIILDDKPLAYKLQYILLSSVFFLFVFDKLSFYQKIIVLIAFFLYSIEQIMFLKRLPLARISLILVILFFAIRNFPSYSTYRETKVPFFFLFPIFIVSGIIIISALGINMSSYSDSFTDKLKKKGTLMETVSEDARWDIANTFYADIERKNDQFIGRGFGGVVEDISLTARLAQDYRATTEAGLPTIVLKGGFILLSYLIFLFIFVIRRYKKAKSSTLNFGFWVITVVWFIFIYGEGYMWGDFSEILLAYSIGAIFSSQHNYNRINWELSTGLSKN